MIRSATPLKLRDHLTALLGALALAHIIGLADRAGYLPYGVVGLDPVAGQMIAMASCVLVYALAASWLYRRRLVAGPLYRCGASRPAGDYGTRFEPGRDRLLDGWHYL